MKNHPEDPHPMPQELEHHQVMAFLRVKTRLGEIPDLAIAVGRNPLAPEGRAFTVWDVAVRNGTWVPFSGDWDLSWEQALKELARRIAFRERVPDE